MKQMLINVAQPEEKRVAIVENGRLIDLDLELQNYIQTKANLYLGKIVRIETSLEAVFVDYGVERHGFLPMKNITPDLFQRKSDTDPANPPKIQDLIKEGQEFIVQVEKEERGNKGAALTTYITLAGRYLVFMPNNPNAGGISRRIEDEDRAEMRKLLSSLVIPEDVGVIMRTAGVGRSQEELQWDIDYLVRLWNMVKKAAKDYKSSRLLFRDSSLMTRTIRDSLRDDIEEVYIDDEATCEEYKAFVSLITPDYLKKIKLYKDNLPLFTKFSIEEQVESAYEHKVDLPSGGSIVIDYNEALVCIDINSAKDTKGNDIEATALNTNLEAAEEIARQLRIRDIGGLIVIDFIDMKPEENKQMVENRLRDSMVVDRAKIQIGHISRFGLLEMSRQRLRPSLQESTTVSCPRCYGTGYIRNVELQSLAIMRQIANEAAKSNVVQLQAKLPINVATYLLNEKRQDFTRIESQYQVNLAILPMHNMHSPQYEFTIVKTDGSQRVIGSSDVKPVDLPKNRNIAAFMADKLKKDSAAIQSNAVLVPAPNVRKRKSLLGFIQDVLGLTPKPETKKPHTQSTRGTGENSRNGRSNHSNRNRRYRRPAGNNGSGNPNPNSRRRSPANASAASAEGTK